MLRIGISVTKTSSTKQRVKNMTNNKLPYYDKIVSTLNESTSIWYTSDVVNVKFFRQDLMNNYEVYGIREKDIKAVLTGLGLTARTGSFHLNNQIVRLWHKPNMTASDIRDSIDRYERKSTNHQININSNQGAAA